MKLTRREFIKSNAAASVAGVTIPVTQAVAAADADDGIRWDKAACRYCGTGCSVLMGVKDGKGVPQLPQIHLHGLRQTDASKRRSTRPTLLGCG
ncbi:MAG: hypothetical protein ABW124_01275 [Candidatus Thiodiazotropha sp. 6PLUC9]